MKNIMTNLMRMQGRDCSLGFGKYEAIQHCRRPGFSVNNEDRPTRLLHTFTKDALTRRQTGICKHSDTHSKDTEGESMD